MKSERRTSKFLVLSYDQEESQNFWDVVPAKTATLAAERVARARAQYATVIEVLSMDDLLATTIGVVGLSTRTAEREFRALEREGTAIKTSPPVVSPPTALRATGGRERCGGGR